MYDCVRCVYGVFALLLTLCVCVLYVGVRVVHVCLRYCVRSLCDLRMMLYVCLFDFPMMFHVVECCCFVLLCTLVCVYVLCMIVYAQHTHSNTII